MANAPKMVVYLKTVETRRDLGTMRTKQLALRPISFLPVPFVHRSD
jgi:hypothetical protein